MFQKKKSHIYCLSLFISGSYFSVAETFDNLKLLFFMYLTEKCILISENFTLLNGH